METTNQYILAKAKQAGICQEWADEIKDADNIHSLLNMYVKGIDFCLSTGFPSNEDLQALAGDLLPKYGIHIDSNVRLANEPFVVLLGNSQADIQAGGYQVTQIFVKHTSQAVIRVADNAFVIIDCFDDSSVHLIASGDCCKVLINVYGNAKVQHESEGKAMVKIVQKHKETY